MTGRSEMESGPTGEILALARAVGIDDAAIERTGELVWRITSRRKYISGFPSPNSTDFVITKFASWCDIWVGCGGSDGATGYAQIEPARFRPPEQPFPLKVLAPRQT